MNRKLSWDQIREFYEDQWVELAECDWDWDDANPRSAVVINSSPDRKKLLLHNKESIILYVRPIRTLCHEQRAAAPSFI